MAIRFIDVKPEGGAESAPSRHSRPPAAAGRPLGSAERPDEDSPEEGESPAVEAEPAFADPTTLPHAKPEPKPRGRKKPMAAVGPERTGPPGASSAPLLEGLVPELQAHAKPTPKPRGRKKAFG